MEDATILDFLEMGSQDLITLSADENLNIQIQLIFKRAREGVNEILSNAETDICTLVNK